MARRGNQSTGINPIDVYTRTRRIIFAQMLKDPALAHQWLEETYRKQLGARGYAGLKAEMNFFELHRKDYDLVMAADIGDATDFVGVIDGTMHRIDVTTNANFKRLKSYEPLQLDGARYKIAVLDGDKFELVDINFPFCPICGKGRVLPTGMLIEENRDDDGVSQYSNDQLLVNICSSCSDVKVADRTTTPFLYDFDHLYRELNAANHDTEDACQMPIDVRTEVVGYARRASRYLSDAFGTRLVAVGGKHYEITHPRDADGFWTYKIEDQLPLVEEHLLAEYPWDIADG
jgi:hypothetical protein